MISLLALSNTLLHKSFNESVSITPMKLQKLIYFIYRDYLKVHDEPLFAENFMCWKYGPVLSSIYDEYKSFGAHRITRFGKDANDSVYILNEKALPEVFTVIDCIWGKYKNCDGRYLSELTHQNGTAWTKANKANYACLKDEDIKNEQSY